MNGNTFITYQTSSTEAQIMLAAASLFSFAFALKKSLHRWAHPAH